MSEQNGALRSRIGFIGLGVMGSRMSKKLLDAGYEVVVHSRSRSSIKTLLEEGALEAKSPKEMASTCRTVILSLPDSASVEEVVLGARGLMRGFRPGSIVIDTSTIDLGVSERIAASAKKRQVYYLDAPVSGGPEGAQAGTLSIMVGGDRSAFARSQKVLRVMGSRVFYLGDSGSGLKMKLFNQALVGVYFLAVAEAYLWSRKLGIKLEDLQRVITSSWGDSPPFEHFVSLLQSGNLKGGARIRHFRKDLSLVLESARKEGASMSLAELAYGYVARAAEMGLEDYDMTAIYKTLDRTKARSVRRITGS
jgi:3-hydroxyisobutyrate dehydrogenase